MSWRSDFTERGDGSGYRGRDRGRGFGDCGGGGFRRDSSESNDGMSSFRDCGGQGGFGDRGGFRGRGGGFGNRDPLGGFGGGRVRGGFRDSDSVEMRVSSARCTERKRETDDEGFDAEDEGVVDTKKMGMIGFSGDRRAEKSFNKKPGKNAEDDDGGNDERNDVDDEDEENDTSQEKPSRHAAEKAASTAWSTTPVAATQQNYQLKAGATAADNKADKQNNTHQQKPNEPQQQQQQQQKFGQQNRQHQQHNQTHKQQQNIPKFAAKTRSGDGTVEIDVLATVFGSERAKAIRDERVRFKAPKQVLSKVMKERLRADRIDPSMLGDDGEKDDDGDEAVGSKPDTKKAAGANKTQQNLPKTNMFFDCNAGKKKNDDDDDEDEEADSQQWAEGVGGRAVAAGKVGDAGDGEDDEGDEEEYYSLDDSKVESSDFVVTEAKEGDKGGQKSDDSMEGYGEESHDDSSSTDEDYEPRSLASKRMKSEASLLSKTRPSIASSSSSTTQQLLANESKKRGCTRKCDFDDAWEALLEETKRIREKCEAKNKTFCPTSLMVSLNDSDLIREAIGSDDEDSDAEPLIDENTARRLHQTVWRAQKSAERPIKQRTRYLVLSNKDANRVRSLSLPERVKFMLKHEKAESMRRQSLRSVRYQRARGGRPKSKSGPEFRTLLDLARRLVPNVGDGAGEAALMEALQKSQPNVEVTLKMAKKLYYYLRRENMQARN